MKQKFYVCRRCGNLVALLRDKGVPLSCCGEEMAQLIPNRAKASEEKHRPVYHIEDNVVHVTVGEVEHPMSEEHWIEWIGLESEHGIQYAQLDPTDKPKAKFALCAGDEVRAVYALCNQHELWRN